MPKASVFSVPQCLCGYLFISTIAPVTTRFASDNGSITFHPKAMS